MGTLNDKLTYLNGTKTAIKNEMIAEGITVTDNDTFRSYPTKMAAKNAETQTVINAQDTLLSTQETKISQLETALDNKVALDLQQATSDATATANDIADGKTAYVNGQKITGVAEGNVPDWTQIGYSDVPQNIIDDFNYSKEIYNNWNDSSPDTSIFYKNGLLHFIPLVDFSRVVSMLETFRQCSKIEEIPLLDTSNVTNMVNAFYLCINLKRVLSINTGKVSTFRYAFQGCQNLEDIPVFNVSSVSGGNVLQGMFDQCVKLSNGSLNNILTMCANVPSTYTGPKTLAYIGLTQTQATTCQSLSNWNDFVAAGWTTGY